MDKLDVTNAPAVRSDVTRVGVWVHPQVHALEGV